MVFVSRTRLVSGSIIVMYINRFALADANNIDNKKVGFDTKEAQGLSGLI